MSAARQFTAAGTLLGLPCSEIVAWASLKGITLRPWEFTALRSLDAKLIEVMGEK